MKHLLGTTMLSLAFAAVAWAEEKPAPPSPPPGGPRPPAEHPLMDRAFQVLDVDKDGKIDRVEFEKGMPKILERVRGEIGKRIGQFRRPAPPTAPAPLPPDLDRIIEEKVRAAVDRIVDRRLPGPPPHRPDEAPDRPRGFGVRPPMAGRPEFRPDDDRPGPDRPDRHGPWERRLRDDRPGRDDRPSRGGRPDRAKGGPLKAIMFLLDANKDRAIDKVEIDRAIDMLKKVDQNNDGKITVDEMIQARKECLPPGGKPDRGPKPDREKVR